MGVGWKFSSTILKLSTRWRGVTSFTLLLLYSQEQCPLYPIYCRLGGSQSWSESYGEENFLTLLGLESRLLSRRASNLVAILTEISRLLYAEK
jgi:hypothetical protein